MTQGKMGKSSYSPSVRLKMKMDAEKAAVTKPKNSPKFPSVKQLMEHK